MEDSGDPGAGRKLVIPKKESPRSLKMQPCSGPKTALLGKPASGTRRDSRPRTSEAPFRLAAHHHAGTALRLFTAYRTKTRTNTRQNKYQTPNILQGKRNQIKKLGVWFLCLILRSRGLGQVVLDHSDVQKKNDHRDLDAGRWPQPKIEDRITGFTGSKTKNGGER